MNDSGIERQGVICLEGSAHQAVELDVRLRNQLAGSLMQLAEAGVLDLASPGVMSVLEALNAGPVSPWVFAHYAGLVRAVSRGDELEAEIQVGLMVQASLAPALPPVLRWGNAGLDPRSWSLARELFDTDSARPFTPVAPDDLTFGRTSDQIEDVQTFLMRVAPATWEEIQLLIRTVVLGVPCPGQPGFGGASTFFLWGAPVINASAIRSVVDTADLLIHEASHQLLLGLAAGQPLAENHPRDRYKSPLRDDLRPIEGIVHAVFVCTRVHAAFHRILDTGTAEHAHRKALEARLHFNAQGAQDGLEVLREHLVPTTLGSHVVLVLEEYWRGPS